LEAKASAALCDQLLAEINNLTSGDDAAMWAHRRLIEKNKLTDVDAHRVEEMFRARNRTFAADGNEEPQGLVDQAIERGGWNTSKPKGKAQLTEIDKSALALPEQRRIRRQIGCQTGLPDLWPATLRCPSSAICATPRAWAQGER